MNRFHLWASAAALATALGVAAWAANPVNPDQWDSGYEESPENSDDVEQGDDWMRQIKKDTRGRLAAEHQFGNGIGDDSNTSDNGLHRIGSARAFVQDAAPTALSDSAEDFSNAVLNGGTGTLLDTETNGAACTDCDGNAEVGHGRLWADKDGTWPGASTTALADDRDGGDHRLMVYDDTTGFVDVRALPLTGAVDRNLLVNGDFEIDGSGAGDTVAEGWSEVLTPTHAHQIASDTLLGYGLSYKITAAGAALEGANQTIKVKKSTTYYISADVIDSVGTCRVTTTGGDTNVSLTSDDGGTMQKLYGTFNSDSSATDVVVNLLSVADTNACEWDNVAVWEETNAPSYVQGFAWRGTTTDATAISIDTDDLISSPTFEIPGNSCYFNLSANFNGSTSAAAEWYTIIEYNLAGGADATACETLTDTDAAGQHINGTPSCVLPTTTTMGGAAIDAGDAIVFNLSFDEIGTGGNIAPSCDTRVCDLSVEMVCP